MKRLFASLLILSVTLCVGYSVLSLWRGVRLYRGDSSKEDLLKAIRLEPSNPDPYYKLALFRQWDIGQINLKESLGDLRKAIERNPLEQEYWLSLAKLLQRMGDRKASDQALERALFLFPTGYTGRWTAGNLLLQRGEYEKAIPHFSYLLTYYPDESSLVYDILFKTTDDADFILDKVVPKNPASLRQYIAYLYEIGDKEGVIKAWQKKASLGYRGERSEALRHIDFLISQGFLAEASRVWRSRLKEEGLPVPSDDSITNGRFESEKILGGGFDWRIGKVAGAEVSFDRSVVFEGKGSLRIDFNGKENVDYHHVYQYVAWKPDTDYALKANMKTRGITTGSGLKIEVIGVGPAFHGASESLIGDNGWKALSVAFRTPARSQGGIVRIRREKTDKFDRFISGTVWIDNISLRERGQ